jgi:hypothetical protein
VDVDSYQFDAVDLVLRPSVEDAGVYHFEQLDDDVIQQLESVLFTEIEERVSEPLNARISELEEVLEAAEETVDVTEGQLKETQDRLTEAETQLEAVSSLRDQLEENLSKANLQLRASNDRNAALLYVLERSKGEKFPALLIEELKDCQTPDEVDENFDRAVEITLSLVAGSPTPSGKTIINPQRTDLDSDAEERMYEYEHGERELSEEEKAQAVRFKRIRAFAGLDMFEE